MTEDPGVGRSSIKEGSDKLWWVSNVHIGNVGIVLKVVLSDVSLNLFSWLIDWAMSDLINLRISLRVRGDWIAAVQLYI